MTAAEEFEAYLDSFLDLYRNHKDLLRFNQFFNIFVAGVGTAPELVKPYMNLVKTTGDWFHSIYEKGKTDGTLRTMTAHSALSVCRFQRPAYSP